MITKKVFISEEKRIPVPAALNIYYELIEF